jgi:hypothetical protein
MNGSSMALAASSGMTDSRWWGSRSAGTMALGFCLAWFALVCCPCSLLCFLGGGGDREATIRLWGGGGVTDSGGSDSVARTAFYHHERSIESLNNHKHADPASFLFVHAIQQHILYY